MTIKTYWALTAEASVPHEAAVDAQGEVQDKIKDLVKQRTGCDAVFFGAGKQVYAGFTQRPDPAIWKKNPITQHGGYALMSPKAKTDAAAALSEARQMADDVTTFDEYCKALWPSMVRECMGRGPTHTSFTITRTCFGFLKGRVVASVPFTDEEPIDKAIIADGFVELTASEYADLQRS